MDKQKASTSPSEEELFNLQVPDDMTISFTPKQYGERLKKTREGKVEICDEDGTWKPEQWPKFTLEQLAELTHISKSRISQIENATGVKNIDVDAAKEFAKVLKCTTQYLLGFTGDPRRVAQPGQPGAPAVRNPIYFSAGKEIYYDCNLVRGFNRDPELYQLVAEILKGSDEERRYYKNVLKALLSHPEYKEQ